MSPNLSGWNRAARLFTSGAVIFFGAVLWPGAPDVFGLVGVTTFVTGMVGWCPVAELRSSHPEHAGHVLRDRRHAHVVTQNDFNDDYVTPAAVSRHVQGRRQDGNTNT
jgi:hypothetical protein